MTLENIKALAENFIKVADKNNTYVSNFLSGSMRNSDANGYTRTKNAYKVFVDAYNAYFGEAYDYSLDYDLAYSVID